MTKKFNPNARRYARRLALQALYQWQLSDHDLASIELHIYETQEVKRADEEYFHELLHEIPKHLDEVDGSFIPYLDRSIDDLNPVELAILRIGAYELLKRTDIPFKVVLDEACELAKKFGAVEGYKYVNGVLNAVAKQQL